MRKALAAGLLALGLAAWAGCCCNCREVPVSFEPFCNWLHYHGPDCCHYPNSCPRCPYWDYQGHFWREPNCGRCASAPGAGAPAAPAAEPSSLSSDDGS